MYVYVKLVLGVCLYMQCIDHQTDSTEERLSSELDLVQNPTKSIGIKLTHTRTVPYIFAFIFPQNIYWRNIIYIWVYRGIYTCAVSTWVYIIISDKFYRSLKKKVRPLHSLICTHAYSNRCVYGKLFFSSYHHYHHYVYIYGL